MHFSENLVCKHRLRKYRVKLKKLSNVKKIYDAYFTIINDYSWGAKANVIGTRDAIMNSLLGCHRQRRTTGFLIAQPSKKF